MTLDINTWKEFKLGVLFSQIYKAEAHVKGELEYSDTPGKNTIRFISRTEMDNGCDCYVTNEGISGIEQGKAIVIGDTTATVSYQDEPFICGDHMMVCRADWINIYTALFLVTILERERYKYSYGRAFKMDLIKNTYVKLPCDSQGKPDWAYMQRYIESLRWVFKPT